MPSILALSLPFPNQQRRGSDFILKSFQGFTHTGRVLSSWPLFEAALLVILDLGYASESPGKLLFLKKRAEHLGGTLS